MPLCLSPHLSVLFCLFTHHGRTSHDHDCPTVHAFIHPLIFIDECNVIHITCLAQVSPHPVYRVAVSRYPGIYYFPLFLPSCGCFCYIVVVVVAHAVHFDMVVMMMLMLLLLFLLMMTMMMVIRQRLRWQNLKPNTIKVNLCRVLLKLLLSCSPPALLGP